LCLIVMYVSQLNSGVSCSDAVALAFASLQLDNNRPMVQLNVPLQWWMNAYRCSATTNKTTGVN
jgi:hypothetical protein